MIVAQQADDVADEGAAVIPTPSPIAGPSSPPQQQQPSQPTHDAKISLDLLHTLMETCTTLTKKVKALEQDKVAQALEIIKLKQRVKTLERKNKLKVSRLKRLRKVGTAQRIESSADTIMDDQEDASKQEEIIANIDADEDVILKDVAAIEKTVEIEENADDDELEPAELKEVVEVVTTAKLTIEVVTAAATIIVATTPITTATITVTPSAARRRKGVVIRDPEETATPSIIIHFEPKSKDKGKQIMEKEDNAVMRYQALKKKPQTEAQSRKNMMIYLRNMVGFKIDYFKGISYDEICPIFEKYSNSNLAFLEKTIEQMEGEDNREDLEVLWQLVTEIFASSKPKNFLDDFLLTTLTYMFEKPDVEAQMLLLVEKRYPLTRFTLDQMLNNVRLEVEEESEVSLELLRFVRQQQQKGFKPE
nr:hypothetical protein [Tanacetum cinerariifolium]